MDNLLSFSYHFGEESTNNDFISHFDVFGMKLKANWELRFYRPVSNEVVLRKYNFVLNRRSNSLIKHEVDVEIFWVYKNEYQTVKSVLSFDINETTATVSETKSQKDLLCVIFRGNVRIVPNKDETNVAEACTQTLHLEIDVETVQNKLCDDFFSLLNQEKFGDVTLKCKDGCVKIHKVILCARSPVFLAMFENPMKESQLDEVDITDMSLEILTFMLTYMYCGRVKNLNLCVACDLLYGAEKYELPELKSICLDFLHAVMTNENVLKILVTADLYNNDLKSAAINHICKNFSAFEHAKEWETLKAEKPSLAFDVYSSVVRNFLH